MCLFTFRVQYFLQSFSNTVIDALLFCIILQYMGHYIERLAL